MDLTRKAGIIDETYRYRWCLPWPTGGSVNHLYVRSGNTIHLSGMAQTWRSLIIIQIRQTVQAHRYALKVPPGDLSFTLDGFPPDKRIRDADNLLKLALDSVMAAFGVTDTRVRHVEATMYDADPANPRLLAKLAPWVNPWGTNGS